ncbi:RpoE-regulated lipoprotein [Raoultella planticola]|uniref:RpoE-regulated lipoprotein n=1 Tax=Raoultella planticola TaxID=575 RepID=A0A485BYK5_RAOPL|nr:RpoE-regulated lipoprotein [Raoultella planticola]
MAPWVECQADGSQHISYAFTGHWNGPEELMPSDDTLKNWKVSKIIWRG